MNTTERKNHLAELSKAYYEGNPQVTDEEFDALHKEYLDAGGEEIVGHGYVVANDRKVRHSTQMGSLDKERTLEGLKRWIDKCHRFYLENCDTTVPLSFTFSPKFDGLAVAVTVKDHTVKLVATRGDGFIGEDVTATALNAPTVAALAKRADGVYAGEVMLPQENLDRANELRGDDSEKLTQIRNAAAGVLRTVNDEKKVAQTLFFADHNDGDWNRSFARDELTDDRLTTTLAEFEKHRTSFWVADNQHVGIDGVVVKVDNADVREGMGHGSRCPRWAVAYKYQDTVYQSVITGVEWGNPGKIGRITPVIEYDVIDIDGGKYTRATAHNLTRFKAFAPAIGDTIAMKKSGDVIPFVVDIDHNGGEKLSYPDTCPSCGNPTTVDGEFLLCTAPRTECDPVNALTLIITALGIKGVQEKMVRKIYDAHLTNTVDSHNALSVLTRLPEGSIASLDGLGVKVEEFIKSALESAYRTAPLNAWIYGLNVDRVGNSVSKALVDAYGDLDGIIEAIEDPSKAKNVRHLTGVNWAAITKAKDKFTALQAWLVSEGITPAGPVKVEVTENSFWSGKRVGLTGTLPIKRAEAQAWLESQGATVSSSFDILVDAGDGSSTKSVKARKQGKTVVNGDEFMTQHYTA